MEKEIEELVQKNKLTAPRVTPKMIDDAIDNIEIVKHVSKTGSVLRWAIINMKNGFSVTGDPSCSVSPENDNAEIGEKVAIDNSRSRIWALEGYLLKDRLSKDGEI